MVDAMISTEEERPWNKRRMYIFIFVVVVIIAGVGAYFGTRDSSTDDAEGEAKLIGDEGDSPTAATPAPTPEPTPSPTRAPTPSPTRVGDPTPAPEPTPSPTRAPTPSPTRAPTPAPAPEPTASLPSSRCSMLEAILVDHDPLHVDAKNWLCNTDTWVPPGNDFDPDRLWNERYAMTVFYFTNGNGWDNDGGWLSSTSVCDWTFTTICLGSDSRVTNFYFDGLDNNVLSGSIPTEIGILLDLEVLNFAYNDLSGTIPTEIGQLTKLKDLWLLHLDATQLSGTIPTEIGQLTELTYLDLEYNALSGTIPTEIGQLTVLQYLFAGVADTAFSGTIPTEIGQLTELVGLRLSSNKLTGQIPTEIGQLTELTQLSLDDNDLTGQIPTELQTLPLNTCYLRDNCFDSLPDSNKCSTFRNCE